MTNADSARPLLTTKLFAPPTRPNFVARPHLLAKLNDGLHRKLTLISAPAGFGKTTLTAEWIASWKPQSANDQSLGNLKLAWLSLEADDNDLTRFWTYLVAALDGVRTGLRQKV